MNQEVPPVCIYLKITSFSCTAKRPGNHPHTVQKNLTSDQKIIHGEFLLLNNNNKREIQKYRKDLKRHFFKEGVLMANKYIKAVQQSHLRNANQN